jgi:hypothetical protein
MQHRTPTRRSMHRERTKHVPCRPASHRVRSTELGSRQRAAASSSLRSNCCSVTTKVSWAETARKEAYTCCGDVTGHQANFYPQHKLDRAAVHGSKERATMTVPTRVQLRPGSTPDTALADRIRIQNQHRARSLTAHNRRDLPSSHQTVLNIK